MRRRPFFGGNTPASGRPRRSAGVLNPNLLVNLTVLWELLSTTPNNVS